MPDNYIVHDGNGGTLIFKAKDTGNGLSPNSIPSDPTGTAYGDANPASVAVQSRQVTWIDRSSGNGTQPYLTASSVAIIAANPNRRGFWIQNLDQNNFMYINFGVAATSGPGSILIPPFSIYEVPLHMMPTGAVYAIGTAGQSYTAKEC